MHPERNKIVEALNPAADAAGRTGDYISLRNAEKVTVLVHITQGNAATVLVSLVQATAANGAGAKALIGTVPTYVDLDTASSDALLRVADARNYTTNAAVANKLVAFVVDASDLDVNNGFGFLAVTTGASNVANITQGTYVLSGLRYQQQNPPTAIV